MNIYVWKILTVIKIFQKCDEQQQYRAIFEASIVSTTSGFTDNSEMSPKQYVTVKNPSETK